MNRITWKNDRRGSTEYGHVGPHELFSITRSSYRPGKGPQYVMQARGLSSSYRTWQEDDVDTLKEHAERALEAYVVELGATFSMPPTAEELERADSYRQSHHEGL